MRTPTADHEQARLHLPTGFMLLVIVILSAAGGCSNLSARGLNAEGVRLFDQARYAEAMQRFQRAIDNQPVDADGYYNMAAAYHRQGVINGRATDFTQAERYYYLCLDRNPEHRDCYRGLAVLFVESGRNEEAFRLLQAWSDRNPQSPEPKIEIARLCEEFGDKEAAAQQLAESLQIDANNPRALAALGRLREEAGDYNRALANYQQSLAADRFQQDVAQRVAALQSTAGVTTASAASGGQPRLVTRNGTIR